MCKNKINDSLEEGCESDPSSCFVQGEAMETSEAEEPSTAFVKAINKENVFYRLLRGLNGADDLSDVYNEWSDGSGDEDVETSEDVICRSVETQRAIFDEAKINIAMLQNVFRLRKEFETYCRQYAVLMPVNMA